MNRFLKVFKNQKFNIIGMIHVEALPGTPCYRGNWKQTLEKARYEANIYAKHKLDSVLIENMHDVPYVQAAALGPETVACLSRVSYEIRQLITRHTPCGVQVLACGNQQALAVAKACDLQYIRAEGFVFGHVADEGYTNACAGQLLRYRRQIDADGVLVFTDLKKKHSSHAITQDVSLLETAKAAELFLSDGMVITGERWILAHSEVLEQLSFKGNSTGHAASPKDLADVAGKIKSPLLIGSGVTCSNLCDYFAQAHGVIVGSHFKVDGSWQNELCEESIKQFMLKVVELREKEKQR